MPTRPKAPIGELGAPGITSTLNGWLDTYETTAELRWPTNVHTYDAMRTDAHIEAVLDAVALPIQRSHWDLDPDSLDGVRPEVIQLVRQDLGLPEEGKRLIRPRGGVNFDDYLRHALLELVYGHMIFEQVYELIGGQARLRKLAPRMPRTIYGWELDAAGGLQAIRQLIPRPNGIWDDVVIPIERLVVFSHRKEGSDPTGRSILRSAYIHWNLKQKLIRIDAIAAERHGAGVSDVTYNPERMTRKAALDIASNVRVGEYAGVAFEEGAGVLKLHGVEGQLHDTLASIKYHDQEISRRMLAMFLDLGQDKGARSLGETFVDFFVMAEQTIANHVEDVTNEHVIRDLVEHNYGPDEPYPLIQCSEITADTDLTALSLELLAKAGYIIPDPELEAWFRKRYGMPAAPKNPTPPPVPPGPLGLPPGPADQVLPVDTTTGTIAQLEARVALLKAGPRQPPTRVRSDL